jgi:RNA polymerase sigma-70 factor (ECF subfamily)
MPKPRDWSEAGCPEITLNSAPTEWPAEANEEVLERCRRGEVSALESLYRIYGSRLWRLCRNLLRNRGDAEDAVQDLFLKVFERLGQFDGRSSFSTWLYRLAVNECLNRLAVRRGRNLCLQKQAPALQPAPPESPLEGSSRLEQREALEGWLQDLDPRSRSLLVLREVEGLSYREIARILECPEGTVMSGLSRARTKLKNHARNQATLEDSKP